MIGLCEGYKYRQLCRLLRKQTEASAATQLQTDKKRNLAKRCSFVYSDKDGTTLAAVEI